MLGMQVLGDKCESVNATHTHRGKERKLHAGGDPPAFSRERLPQTHTPLQWANYTHEYKGLKSMS